MAQPIFARNRILQHFLRAVLALVVVAGPGGHDARAEWREELGAFRALFMVDEEMEKALERHEPFRQGLQDALGIPVELRPERSLRKVILSMSDRPTEYMVLPATAYAAIWLECECIEPLAIAQNAAGAAAVEGVLIVREGSPYTRPEALAGKSVFGLSRYSLAGYRMARQAIEDASATSAQGSTRANWRFEADAETALAKFVAGEGDALAGFQYIGEGGRAVAGGTLARLEALSDGRDRFRVIWRSAHIPNTVHAIRKNLNGEAKRLLRSYVIGLETRDPFTYDLLEPDFAGGFAPARQSQFDGLIAFLTRFKPTEGDDGTNEAPSNSDAVSTDLTGAVSGSDDGTAQ